MVRVLTPNGALFKTDSQGFLPEMMETMYKERVIYKNKMLDAKKRNKKQKMQVLKKKYLVIIIYSGQERLH